MASEQSCLVLHATTCSLESLLLYFLLYNVPTTNQRLLTSRRFVIVSIGRMRPRYIYLLADTAFPRVSNALKHRIKAPLKRSDRLPDDPRQALYLRRLSTQITSARQAAEWGMKSLQGCFSRLKVPLPADDTKFCAEIIETTIRLHNLRTKAIGVNQIMNVYVEN